MGIMRNNKNHAGRIATMLTLCLALSVAVVGCDTVLPPQATPDPQAQNPDPQNQPNPTPTPTPGPQPANQAPVADAGANQAALAGDAVSLDGSASSDPDGDAITFSWSQTGGTAASLADADTATPSFTAPAVDESLTFELTVQDGDGLTDTATVMVSITVPTEPRLYIANFGGNNVTSYAEPWMVNGNIAPDTNLAGAQTQLFSPADIVVNSANQLLAANFAAASITTYDNADASNGNLAPDGNVQGAATGLANPVTLAINPSEDLLFVADVTTDVVQVYAGTSTSTFNGNIAPTRTISSAALNNPFGINFGANDDLYVANNGGTNILVFANASSINGTVAPTRIITSAVFANVFDVFVDDNDTMYVVDATGFIYTFFDASTLNGVVAPDLALTVPPAVFLTAIAVDSAGTGYIVDATGNAVYSYDDMDTLNGAINPDRTITGANTQLATPIRVFLVE